MAIQKDIHIEYGHRLIPLLIDEKASFAPDQTYCYLPRTARIEDGFQAITYRRFSNAINACSWWIEAEIGKSEDFATLAYLGPSDLRNILIIVAAIKTGHKALLASPRNSLKAHLNLLDNTQCKTLLTAEPLPHIAQDILASRPMRHVIVPKVESWLEAPIVASYSYGKTFQQARYEPFVVVHTSGSTGLPKVVIVNHGTIAATDAFNAIGKDVEYRPMVLDALRNKRCFVTMPSFHAAGIDFMLPKALFHGLVPILGPAATPVNAELVDAMHRLNLVESSIVAPSILQDIATSPLLLGNLDQVSAIMYGGGPLPPSAGNAISFATRLYNLMGSSEMWNLPTEQVDREDWEYFRFSPLLGYQMRHHSEDRYELGFLRASELSQYQGVFSSFPDRQEYLTSDLYSKHPTKPDLWKYSGRTDDIITLTNGEKVNPVAMESLLNALADVRSVLVLGQARFQPALLIEAKEPPSDRVSKENFIEKMWSIVQEVNKQCDAHARLSRDLILFTPSEKPFQRAGKGTVQRRVTVDSYRVEIEKAYEKFEKLTKLQEPEAAPTNDWSLDSLGSVDRSRPHTGFVEDCLVRLVCKTTGWAQLDTTANFFSLGMDSLQVINVVRSINSSQSGIGPTRLVASTKTIYANPTISLLAKACVSHQQSPKSDIFNVTPNTSTSVLDVEKLLTKYSWDLPITCRPPTSQVSCNVMYVLLTGSTGSLGSYVLGDLLKNARVAHVYCLNRSLDSETRQRTSNQARGLTADWSSHHVSFIRSDLSQEHLGMGLEVYESLLRNVTHIVHNAWEVNFNLPLTSFETPHLVGVRQFIEFSARSAKGASILFVSSVSSSMDWPLKHIGPVPERIIDDSLAALPMGYAQSKHVAERLLSRASSVAGIPTTICRIGQVAGPVNMDGTCGFWKKQEWLPSLIASSKYLRKIPESLGPSDSVDWIPVDILSRVLVELLERPSIATSYNASITSNCFSHNKDHDAVDCQDMNTARPHANGFTSNSIQRSDRKPSVVVYHAVNPCHTTWSSLLPVVKAYFSDTPLETVSLKEWVDALSQSAAYIEDININPAIRLLDFYDNLSSDSGKAHPVFETKHTVRQSEQLAKLEAVKPEWMEMWLKQWDF